MRDAKTNTLAIRTPEGIEFSMFLASPATRFFAWAVDLACILAGMTVLSTGLSVFQFLIPDLALATLMLMYFALSIGYGIALEWFWRGQTLGKRLLGLRVIDEQGLRLQFSQIAIRNLLRFVDALPALYLVGGITCLISRRAQRLGDYAANTVVIRRQPSVTINIEQITSGKFNSFREHPHLEARLRHRVSSREAAIAFQALLRREELEPRARVDLFRDIAAHFRALVAFPEDATFGLTDEQYVRNVVDSLFRTRETSDAPMNAKSAI